MAQQTKIQTVSGVRVGLVAGVRYLSCGPFFSGDVSDEFLITIREQSTDVVVHVIKGLRYNEANEFMAAFNGSDMSFDGRIW